jgi:YVTN family beta-propeller protein
VSASSAAGQRPPADADADAAGHGPRRASSRAAKVAIVTAAGLVVLAAPVAALGLTGDLGTTHPASSYRNAPMKAARFKVGNKATFSGGATSPKNVGSPASGVDYTAYVSLISDGAVARIDVATDTIVSESISADSTEGVAVTPDGSTVYAAETGQYDVIAANPATGAETAIEVGPYPQDVAVSPDGSQVYATVTGSDTGPGSSDVVAVISTATNAVTRDIKVGPAPRQVVFAPDGKVAYVTTETGVYAIDTATGTVTGSVPLPGAQGIAVSPDGSTLYVTSPNTGQLWVLTAAGLRVTGKYAAGAEPYAVALDGTRAYVADMNSDSVAVLDTASGRIVASVPVGHLPGAVAVTPDGSQVWVGNVLTGSISVIDPATDKVTATIGGGPGTATLDAGPMGIAFASASS